MRNHKKLLRNFLLCLLAYIVTCLIIGNLKLATWQANVLWWLCSVPNYYVAKELFIDDYNKDKGNFWIKFFILNGAIYAVPILITRLLHLNIHANLSESAISFFVAWILYYRRSEYNTAAFFFTGFFAVSTLISFIDSIPINLDVFKSGAVRGDIFACLACYLKHRFNIHRDRKLKEKGITERTMWFVK